MKYISRDSIRITALVVLGLSLTLLDVSLNAVAFSAGVVVLLAGVSHVTRRVVMPKLDLQQIAIKAIEEKNVAAAIVVASIVYLLTTLIEAGVTLMS